MVLVPSIRRGNPCLGLGFGEVEALDPEKGSGFDELVVN